MNIYGFNSKVDAASHIRTDAWQARTEKNKDRDDSRLPQFGMSGCRDLQGNGLRGDEPVQMPESNSLANRDEKREYEGQFLEIGDGLKVCKTAFWLDVVPGI